MPQFGFVIDQRKCVGCHACTVACKSENDVPVGSFRTWVKYTEKGVYPTVKRHFTVLRCNHCDEAPCVEICPVGALEKRPDAIVDLDRDICIGCASCLQACPYDAIYLDQETGVAGKCHYCAHRTEIGLEPACVVVCPERAIIPGDTSDESSEIASMLRDLPTNRRKVDKGTSPRVWYVDALPESLEPGRAAEPVSYLWSQRSPADAPPPEWVQRPEPDVTTTLDVPHPGPWGWHIWSYLLTKNISAGAGMIAPFLAFFGVEKGGVRDFIPEVSALVFLAITMFLLIHDLGRPERFLSILTRGNPRSWLVKGAWFLTAFGIATTAGLVMRAAGASAAADITRWVNLPLAVMASGYSAWLFAQCRGRDLWLQKGVFSHLIARAALLGTGIGMMMPVAGRHGTTCARAFVGLAIINALWMFMERMRRSDNPLAARAEALLRRSAKDQAGIMLVVIAAVTTQVGDFFLAEHSPARIYWFVAGMLLAVIGLFFHERSWIRAGQAIPIS